MPFMDLAHCPTPVDRDRLRWLASQYYNTFWNFQNVATLISRKVDRAHTGVVGCACRRLLLYLDDQEPLQKVVDLLDCEDIVETATILVNAIINTIVNDLSIDHAELLHTFAGSMDLQKLLAVWLDESSNEFIWEYSTDELDVLLIWRKVISG
jgi:hypothetical protein